MIKPIYVCGPNTNVERMQDFIHKNFAEEFKLKPEVFIIYHDSTIIPEDAQYIYIIESPVDEAKWMEFYYTSSSNGHTPVLVKDF